MFTALVCRQYGSWGEFDEIETVFNLLLPNRLAQGYFPEPTKSVLVVKPTVIKRAKARFDHLGFQVTTGTRYLGGFIGTATDDASHIRAKVGEWATGITRHSSVIQSSPKPPYAHSSRVISTSSRIYSV